MSILLNKDEILKALNEIDPNFQNVVYHSDIRIARAQLKKIVGRLDEYIYVRTDAPHKTTIDLDVWEALKKEAGL